MSLNSLLDEKYQKKIEESHPVREYLRFIKIRILDHQKEFIQGFFQPFNLCFWIINSSENCCGLAINEIIKVDEAINNSLWHSSYYTLPMGF